MKNSIFIFIVMLFISSSLVFAEDWVPAKGRQCDKVCKSDKIPVELGAIAGNEKSFVCAGEFTPGSNKDTGFRAGYTTMSDGALGCAICGGEKCKEGRIPDKFLCLCVNE